MTVVSNTTPLSELAKVGQLRLLQGVWGRIIIPQEVYDEVTRGTHPAATVVPLSEWIEVRSVSDPQRIANLQASTGLDLGECAAIALAEEVAAEQLLLDDLDARREAVSRGLPVIGTVGILVLAKDAGLISTVGEVLDALIARGKRISQPLYEEVLAIAGESS